MSAGVVTYRFRNVLRKRALHMSHPITGRSVRVAIARSEGLRPYDGNLWLNDGGTGMRTSPPRAGSLGSHHSHPHPMCAQRSGTTTVW